jgi:hypothetical protein
MLMSPPPSGEPQGGFERAERRVTTFLVGKLVCAGSNEHLCRVRNLSESGMLIETHKPLGFGSWVDVELRCGQRLQGTVAWAGTGRAGVQFVARIDVDKVLADAKLQAVQGEANQPRAPRFKVSCPAQISSNGRYIDVMLENVSQSGACLQLPRPPKQGTHVILAVPGLPSRHCTSRWTEQDRVGLSFSDVIPYHELAAWLEHVTAG